MRSGLLAALKLPLSNALALQKVEDQSKVDAG